MAFRERWRIRGLLATLSPLHIGSGKEVTDRNPMPRKKADSTVTDPIQVIETVVNHSKRPYLPGKSLKGVLRGHGERLVEGDARGLLLLEHLLGSRDMHADHAVGGLLEVRDAPLVKAPDELGPLTHVPGPYWDATRKTCVATSVRLERRTRTALEKCLFHTEYVPPDSQFELEFTGIGLEQTHVELLLAILEGFNPTAATPLQIGGDTANGWGRCHWELKELAQLGEKSAGSWLAAAMNGSPQTVGYQMCQPLKKTPQILLQRKGSEIADRWEKGQVQRPDQHLRITLALNFPEGLLVNDPSQVKDPADGDDITPDHLMRRDRHGQPLLPAQALRGAIRSQAERIVETVAADSVFSPNDLEVLFGSTAWQTPLSLTDFEVGKFGSPGHTQSREFVAIDRFTGGSAEGAKFNSQPIWRPTLTGTLAVDLSRIKVSQQERLLRLLMFVLRDLHEGDVAVGMGASKGWGTAKIVQFDPHLPQSASPSICQLLERGQAFFTAANEQPAPASTSGSQVAGSQQANQASRRTSQGSSDRFYNPFVFLPIAKASDEQWMPTKEIQPQNGGTNGAFAHVTHASYLARSGEQPVYSGRLICRVTTERPTIIGGEQEPDSQKGAALVKPYRLPDETLAIPGTTLRGLISFLAEAASGSSMRVLTDTPYSRRANAREPEDRLPVLGMIVCDQAGRRWIAPLSLPPVKPPRGSQSGSGPVRCRIPETQYGPDSFPPIYPILLKDYKHLHTDKNSHSPDCREYWYMEVPEDEAIGRWEGSGRDLQVVIPRPHVSRSKFITASDAAGRLIREEEFQGAGRGSENRYVRGVLRILGLELNERAGQLPTKKYELFLPLDPAFGDGDPESENYPKLDAEEACCRFEHLADERTRTDPDSSAPNTPLHQRLPFTLKGARRNGGNAGHNVRLRTGDVVYFRLANNGRVAAVAISSLWRCDLDDCYDFFRKSYGDWILPLGRRQGTDLSPVEQLFGVVEQRDRMDSTADPQRPGAYALASRVRFFDAVPPANADTSDWLTREVMLKTLNSPKLPCPTLYFEKVSQDRSGQNGFIDKQHLRPGQHRPLGRKVFLHGENASQPTWKTANEGDRPHLKMRATPLKVGAQFYFHVDFDNLTEQELSMLAYCLRPSGPFRHKLGLGKPLGLGSVRIDPFAVAYVNRQKRYHAADPFADPRYEATQVTEQAGSLGDLPDRYLEERLLLAENDASSAEYPTLPVLQDSYRQQCPEPVRKALDLVGDPEKIDLPVHYPQVIDAETPEGELFEWFVANDHYENQDHQKLHSLADGLTPLKRLPRRAGRGGRPGGRSGAGGSPRGGGRQGGRHNRDRRGH